MTDTPEQQSVELWECQNCGEQFVGFPPRDCNECACPNLTGPHRYVPESESINKAELVEWLEERQKPPPLALDFGESEQWEARHSALQAVLDHINESEESR